MKLALVQREGADPAPLRLRAEVVKRALARGDEVLLLGSGFPAVAGARVDLLQPFGLTAGARRKAFAKAADERTQRAGFDLVLGFGDATFQDVVRLDAGCRKTRVDSGAKASDDDAVLEIEARALAQGAFRALIAPSSLVQKDVLRRHGVAADRVHVVSEGVDTALVHPGLRATAGARVRAEWKLAESDFVVLLAASELDKMELDRMLRVLPEIARERPNVKIVVLGADASFTKHKLDLGPHVRFADAPGTPVDLIAASDLCLLHTRYSPFVSATLDALACGVPVITTAWNGASDLVEQDRSGSVLAGFQDSQSLYRELAAWTRPERRAEGGAIARRAAEAHSIEREADRTLAVLDEVLSQRRAR
jgi:UDP-glucose:(heptosyl)LPS alpha-1,3-glucosyltransferase